MVRARDIKSAALDWCEDEVCLAKNGEPMQIAIKTPSLQATLKSAEERAVEILEHPLLPCRCLCMHLKRRRTKPVTIHDSTVCIPSCRNGPVNDVTIDVISSFPCTGLLLPLMECCRWKVEMVKIQRVPALCAVHRCLRRTQLSQAACRCEAKVL
ncbi:hypothetical protein TraAM80_00694 [Trypanosoma rangeli]|uniref:Uncharacterized protein n=1 Tax=Trypanosoma rangeli TaxID=5698 RepID=A0A3R7LCU9_TRYRA|nr:uncharacterized protein TraAM80_00694 [Trypanosoma rangeli]RNF11859.1 hypothetical protein TraAM80_00694 [Trypanosoma rangeli]|eukprot:RNF11859.1 hypothetical protein TraAM80_00694 [Trypanosoma rangeli]